MPLFSLGGQSEGGFIAPAGHLRWPFWIPAQGRNDEVVGCVLTPPLQLQLQLQLQLLLLLRLPLVLVLVLGLLLTFLPPSKPSADGVEGDLRLPTD
ncbi:hypothetical protein, partial [Silvimonas terrae]|uniref:hypothetical protein n=1 Tax=Silvimonas terrae TaxID=300266 RepID=UPI001C84AA9C